MVFLRDTDNPAADIKRGFSCNVNAWFDTEEDAIDYQKRHGALSSPKKDPFSGKWCADPELGLSGFGFHDEITFSNAMKSMINYHTDKIGVFTSKSHQLGAGLDGEDVFNPDQFIGYLSIDSNYESFLRMIQHK